MTIPRAMRLSGCFALIGLRPEAFASAANFLKSKRPDVPSGLVLDVRLKRLSGLDVQAKLARAGINFERVECGRERSIERSGLPGLDTSNSEVIEVAADELASFVGRESSREPVGQADRQILRMAGRIDIGADIEDAEQECEDACDDTACYPEGPGAQHAEGVDSIHD